MEKEIKCQECGQKTSSDYLCDTCGENLIDKFLGVPVTISFSYGHELDGESYNFCDYKCLLKFIIAELRKQQ
jgi:hypothetical protein